ncbi:MAG TPA: hypothetical protein VFK13_08140 [Gemmatimonadaceae bacterium]|nr:hypothetical protein [Gemmatimonadaceae bacterium]
MRHSSRALAAALALVGALSLGACASSPRAASPSAQAVPQEGVQIHVQNNLVPPTGVTVWIVPSSGSRHSLGSLNPGASGDFSYPAPNAQEFVLVARTTGGTEITSRSFTITSRSDEVAWDLNTNTVSTGS